MIVLPKFVIPDHWKNVPYESVDQIASSCNEDFCTVLFSDLKKMVRNLALCENVRKEMLIFWETTEEKP